MLYPCQEIDAHLSEFAKGSTLGPGKRELLNRALGISCILGELKGVVSNIGTNVKR